MYACMSCVDLYLACFESVDGADICFLTTPLHCVCVVVGCPTGGPYLHPPVRIIGLFVCTHINFDC